MKWADLRSKFLAPEDKFISLNDDRFVSSARQQIPSDSWPEPEYMSIEWVENERNGLAGKLWIRTVKAAHLKIMMWSM